jgi:hypothetical protein
VATLVAGGLVETPADNAEAPPPGPEAFAQFLPRLQARAPAGDNGNAGDGALMVDDRPGETEPNPGDFRWQAFQLGLGERRQEQAWQMWAAGSLGDMLDNLQAVFGQFRDLFGLPARVPDPTGPGVDPPADGPATDAPGQAPADVPATAPDPTAVADGPEETEVFAHPDLLPPVPPPQGLPGGDEGGATSAPGLWPAPQAGPETDSYRFRA